jgi:hypothetical protein
MEQVPSHEQGMAQNISHPKHLIFEGSQTHTQKMELITENAKKYWLI